MFDLVLLGCLAANFNLQRKQTVLLWNSVVGTRQVFVRVSNAIFAQENIIWKCRKYSKTQMITFPIMQLRKSAPTMLNISNTSAGKGHSLPPSKARMYASLVLFFSNRGILKMGYSLSYQWYVAGPLRSVLYLSDFCAFPRNKRQTAPNVDVCRQEGHYSEHRKWS